MMNQTYLSNKSTNVSLVLDDDDGLYTELDYEVLLLKINEHEVKQMLPVILFYAFILILGLFGNFLVLLVYTYRYKRSQARVFILFLATIDFLMCLFGLPYQMFDMTHPYTYTNSVMCKIWTFIVISLFHISVFGLVVIAVDRYIKICHPLGKFHTQYFGKKRACVIAVVLGLLLSWPILFLYGSAEMETGVLNITGHACFYTVSDPESNITLIYSTTTVCFCVGSTVCLIVLYSCVVYRIYSRYRNGMSLRTIQQHAEDSTCYNSEDKRRPTITVQNDNEQQESIPHSNIKNINGKGPSKGVQFVDLELENICLAGSKSNGNHRMLDGSENIDIDNEYHISNLKCDIDIDASDQRTKNNISQALPLLHTQNIPKSETNIHSTVDTFEMIDLQKFPVRNGKKHALYSSTDEDEPIPNRKFRTLTRESSISLNDLEHRIVTNSPSERLYKFVHPKATRDVRGNSRRHSCLERSALRQGGRLSLPFNSLASSSSKTSLNSYKSGSTFVDGGMRIHGGSIYRKSMRNPEGNAAPRGHSKITKIMITITTVFILSYTPALIIIVWSNLQPEIWDIISIHETLVFEFCLRFYLVNNICNPFIYGFWDKRFKREIAFSFRKLLNSIRCTQKK